MIQILENFKTIKEEKICKLFNSKWTKSPFPDSRIEGVLLDTRKIDLTVGYQNLTAISRIGVGTDNIDLELCRERGIKVLTTPCDELIDAVAEFTIFQIINFLRNYKLPRVNLSDLQIGIIGYGRIGYHVEQILKNGFFMEPFIYDIDKGGWVHDRFTNRLKLLMESDIICIFVSGNKEVIDMEDIMLMKKNPIIVNMARGGCVNVGAVNLALNQKRIGGYITDVDNPNRFKEVKNVLLTPHIASDTYDARKAMETMAVSNLFKTLKGEE